MTTAPYSVWSAAGGAGTVTDSSLAIVAAAASAIAKGGDTAVIVQGDRIVGPTVTVKHMAGDYIVNGTTRWSNQLQEILDNHG